MTRTDFWSPLFLYFSIRYLLKKIRKQKKILEESIRRARSRQHKAAAEPQQLHTHTHTNTERERERGRWK